MEASDVASSGSSSPALSPPHHYLASSPSSTCTSISSSSSYHESPAAVASIAARRAVVLVSPGSFADTHSTVSTAYMFCTADQCGGYLEVTLPLALKSFQCPKCRKTSRVRLPEKIYALAMTARLRDLHPYDFGLKLERDAAGRTIVHINNFEILAQRTNSCTPRKDAGVKKLRTTQSVAGDMKVAIRKWFDTVPCIAGGKSNRYHYADFEEGKPWKHRTMKSRHPKKRSTSNDDDDDDDENKSDDDDEMIAESLLLLGGPNQPESKMPRLAAKRPKLDAAVVTPHSPTIAQRVPPANGVSSSDPNMAISALISPSHELPRLPPIAVAFPTPAASTASALSYVAALSVQQQQQQQQQQQLQLQLQLQQQQQQHLQLLARSTAPYWAPSCSAAAAATGLFAPIGAVSATVLPPTAQAAVYVPIPYRSQGYLH